MKRFKYWFLIAPAISLLLNGSLVTAVEPTDVLPIATVVTESHWIGINSKQLTGGPHVGTIGVNTNYLTEKVGQTKWIGKNTQYITELVQTATISGAPTTITNFPAIQIIGPVDNDGNPTGSFDFIMAPALASQVQQLVDTLCTEAAGGERSCSADFDPQVQSLLKTGYGTLTERNPGYLAGGVVALLSWAIRGLSDRQREVPLLIHVDYDSYSSASYTTVPSSYVMTFTAIPKQTPAVGVAVPGLPKEDDEEGCWTYVGIDIEPMTEDGLSETSDVDEPAEPDELDYPDDFDYLEGPLRRRGPTTTDEVDDSEMQGGGVGKSQESHRRTYLTPSIERKHLFKACWWEKAIHQQNRNLCNKAYSKSHCSRPAAPKISMVTALFNKRSPGVEHGLDPATYWFVPGQDAELVGDACHIAQLAQKGQASQWNYPVPYDQTKPEKSLTVDHIYETSIIPTFFLKEFSAPGDIRCKSFVPMFDKPDTGRDDGKNPRFATLFGQSSNPTPGNWALSGVDQRINNLKGVMFNPALEGWPAMKSLVGLNTAQAFDELFQTWNNAGLSMDFINKPVLTSYFSERNTAVYAAFRDFERIQQCERDPKDTTQPTKWAEVYKNYISNLLKTNEALVQGRIQHIIETIQANKGRMISIKNPDLPNKYGKAFLSLQSIYPVSHFKFDHNALLTFPEKSIGIRDGTPTDSCTKPTPSATCVERTIVDCVYHYTDRPELSASNCPPIPPLPASCASGSLIPVIKGPVSARYCVPVDDPKICTLATSFRWGGQPKEWMGKNAFVFDNKCNEIGQSNGIKSGTSITSKLPYTVEIEYFDAGGVLMGGYRMMVLRYAYAGQVKGEWSDDKNKRREDCFVTDKVNYDRSISHYVNRCPFDCSAK